MGPPECDEIVHLIDDLTRLLEEKRHVAMATAAVSTSRHDFDLAAELDERAEELQGCANNLDLYVRHLMRKALSHTITPSLLDTLKTNPKRMHIIVDYKQKPLPTRHREAQTAAFGKKGKSLHGATCLRWNSTRADFEVLNVRVVCDDSNQTWFHTLAALRTTASALTDQGVVLKRESASQKGWCRGGAGSGTSRRCLW
jgi:hypothetical protein